MKELRRKLQREGELYEVWSLSVPNDSTVVGLLSLMEGIPS